MGGSKAPRAFRGSENNINRGTRPSGDHSSITAQVSKLLRMASIMSSSPFYYSVDECALFNVDCAADWEKIIKSPKIETIGTLIVQGGGWDLPEARACIETLPNNIVDFKAVMTDTMNLDVFAALRPTLESISVVFFMPRKPLDIVVPPWFTMLHTISMRIMKGEHKSSIRFSGDSSKLRVLNLDGFKNVCFFNEPSDTKKDNSNYLVRNAMMHVDVMQFKSTGMQYKSK